MTTTTTITLQEDIEYIKGGKYVKAGILPPVTIENMKDPIQRAYHCYNNILGRPNREEMKVKVQQGIAMNDPKISISVEDVDLLPWNDAGITKWIYEQEEGLQHKIKEAERQEELERIKEKHEKEMERERIQQLQKKLKKRKQDRKQDDSEQKQIEEQRSKQREEERDNQKLKEKEQRRKQKEEEERRKKKERKEKRKEKEEQRRKQKEQAETERRKQKQEQEKVKRKEKGKANDNSSGGGLLSPEQIRNLIKDGKEEIKKEEQRRASGYDERCVYEMLPFHYNSSDED